MDSNAPRFRAEVFLRLVLVLLLLGGFLVAIQCMGDAFKLMGEGASEALFENVKNPFAALAVGILATVLVQSSSTTTSMIVALVGSGELPLAYAVPMVMGANIGTTITNTLVSIGHVRQSAPFRRAFAAATVHDFFNLLCVVVLLPLELGTGALSHTAEFLTRHLAGAGGGSFHSPVKTAVKFAYKQVLHGLQGLGLEGTALAIAVLVLGIAMTFVCLIFITKNMRALIAGPLEAALNRSLGRSGLIGIVVGVLVTVAVQSSSITTSLLVPLCAAGILSLENAFPIMLGANIGTTVTALLASTAADSKEGLTIAIVHTLFNVVGTLIFFPVRRLRQVPIRLARQLAILASRNPLYVAGYVGGVFVLMPLAGIWIFNRLGGQ
ncbi:MAG: Na/Pi cotransporter family protein [Planctomycetes bacterium]|nr:Na/Pi cotransporter family protein [Planctomycetota bacterium]